MFDDILGPINKRKTERVKYDREVREETANFEKEKLKKRSGSLPPIGVTSSRNAPPPKPYPDTPKGGITIPDPNDCNCDPNDCDCDGKNDCSDDCVCGVDYDETEPENDLWSTLKGE
jgi:hypothetical protein